MPWHRVSFDAYFIIVASEGEARVPVLGKAEARIWGIEYDNYTKIKEAVGCDCGAGSLSARVVRCDLASIDSQDCLCG
jgi:hypothetical protein